jgi:cellulose biosynthesis protein BcsQ
MRSLLLAGAFHGVLSKYGVDIVNRDSITLDGLLPFLQQNQPAYDQIIITDDAISNNDVYSIITALKSLLIFLEKENDKKPVLLITNNVLLQNISIAGVEICQYYAVRITISQYLNNISHSTKNSGIRTKKKESKIGTQVTEEIEQATAEQVGSGPKPSKHKLLERFRKDRPFSSPDAAYAEREFAAISSEISRVIAIVGCRGSGVTSTAVNLAHIASNKGLSTMLIDLDVANCALNLYFNEYYEIAKADHDIAHSLIRNLAKPQDYKMNTFNLSNLYMTTLAYSFRDSELLGRFYTAAKLVNMLAVFRKHFQLCLLDMPFEVLGQFAESILFIDDFGICVPNNLYSITGALRIVQNLFIKQDQESLFSKSKIIVSKYNDQSTLQDESFSPERVCELLLELSDIHYESASELAGYIPYFMDFDSQLETDIPIAGTNAHLEKSYTDILLRMIKGVR